MVWVVNATPWPLYPHERPGTHCIGGWVDPRICLDGCGKCRSLPGARSESLYQLRYRGPNNEVYRFNLLILCDVSNYNYQFSSRLFIWRFTSRFQHKKK